MAPLPEDVRADLAVLLAAVGDRRLEARWDYYSGKHPKIYATPKLRRTFKRLADSFDENYCGLAINARLSRLEVIGWDGPDADAAQEVWDRSKLGRRQSRLWRYALVHSSAALIADPEAEGGARLRINPATMAHGQPDPDDPDVLAWIGKVWQSGKVWRATLMYPDEVVRLVSTGDKMGDARSYLIDDDDPGGRNPLGVVPGATFTPYDEAQPLIDSIAGLQNRINKIASNKFIAAEFGAFRQRVFFTTQAVTPYDVRNAPDEAIVLDPGDGDAKASVQEMQATDLQNYDRAKDAEVDALFTLASLPRHMRVNPGTPPSGEAIKADEGPFVECITDLQNNLGESTSEAMAVLGIDAEPIWRDPAVHNELVQAQTVGAMVDAGIPWQAAVARYADWSDDDIAEAAANVAPTTTTADAVGAALLSTFNAPGVPTAATTP